jgi:hypothetical protein
MLKPIVNTITRLWIVEGDMSLYTYHLSVTGMNGQPSLCGSTRTMQTSIPMTTWNHPPSHIRSKYCRKCTEIAKQQGFNVPDAVPETLVFDPKPGSGL